MNNCQAYQQRDGSYRCDRCNLLWGKNDTPAPCMSPKDYAFARLARIRKELWLAPYTPR